MYHRPVDLVRLFLSLFQDLPPMSRSLYIPGAVLLIGYPVLSVAQGADHEGRAFVTAFVMALAVRIGMGFEGMVRRMLTRYSAGRAALMAVLLQRFRWLRSSASKTRCGASACKACSMWRSAASS